MNENGGSSTITVTRTGGSDGAVGVGYATSNGTATAGSDYTARSGTLSWANGDSENKTFTVPILDDSVYEGNKTVNLTLSSPTGGAALGSTSTAVLTIVDNDMPLTFNFNTNNQEWRRAGFYDGGTLNPIEGYFSDLPVGWTNGTIYIGSRTLTLPSSPTDAEWIHWDFNSPNLSEDKLWNEATTFGYDITGSEMTGYSGDAMYVQTVLRVRKPDSTETFFTDGKFHKIWLGNEGYWQHQTVSISGLEMPAGTVILNINLRIFFRPSSWIGGHILLDNVIAN